ncbi:nicotinate phosphoribosyltransferase [Xanthomonas fragariae]|nr:nicotinate phosphoribosyltransferase [Xanthomonas fragariae]
MVRCNGQPVAKLSDSRGKSMCEDIGYLRYLRDVFGLPPIPDWKVDASIGVEHFTTDVSPYFPTDLALQQAAYDAASLAALRGVCCWAGA